MSRRFPAYRQHDAADCGPSCLRMIAAHYGKNFHLSRLRELSHITRDGVTLLGVSDAAESIGFTTMGANLTYKQLCEEAPLPCIVHWEKNHFVVVYKVRKRWGKEYIYIADPAKGKVVYDKDTFLKSWLSTGTSVENDTGICLLLEPGEKFFEQESEKQGSRFQVHPDLP